jgi:phosphoserine phosphatase
LYRLRASFEASLCEAPQDEVFPYAIKNGPHPEEAQSAVSKDAMTLMQSAMTMIAGPGAVELLPEIAGQLAGIVGGKVDWLAPSACDFAVGSDAAEAEAAARAAIGDQAIDVIVQPAAGRKKRLLVADLESTIIENEMLEELADFLGMRAHVAEITRRAMNGEIDFVGALNERVALLCGLPEAVLDEAAARIRLTRGAEALIATLRRDGVRSVLVSGGFTVFAEPVAARLGFDRVIANRLDVANGMLTGTVTPPIVTAATKHDALVALAAEAGLGLDATLAVGDGANDLPMLGAAGLGIAFHAKPAVAAASRWRIDHADLTALLYAQGYRREEIRTQP